MAEAAIELHGSGGLTGSEAAALAECEEAIEAGLRSFVVVGDRLYRIREERLYRATHGTFEAYCRDRWTFSVRQAERLLAAASVCDQLVALRLPAPATESVARELSRAPAAERVDVWREVLEVAPDGRVTAKLVRDVVDARLEPNFDDEEDPEPEPLPADSPSVSDIELTKQCIAGLSESDRARLYRDLGLVRLDMISSLRAHREQDREYARFQVIDERLRTGPAEGGRRIELFVLAGGELALALLGLDYTATPEKLAEAYRPLALAAHPDRGGNQEEMARLNWARGVVRDFVESKP